MGSLLFNLIGVLLIIFIVWWFWLGKKTKAVKVTKDVIDVKVANGVYVPNAIEATAGQVLTLRFTREDETPCAATVVFGDFDVSAELPIGKSIELRVTPDKPGEYEFTCQMGMYRGKLVVK